MKSLKSNNAEPHKKAATGIDCKVVENTAQNRLQRGDLTMLLHEFERLVGLIHGVVPHVASTWERTFVVHHVFSTGQPRYGMRL